MQRLLNILFWSVISAAFIGPGTITTAASAGARFDLSLLWALLFSTIACLVLQEASARLTIASGRNLGQAIRSQFHGSVAGVLVLFLVVGAIILGCAAYEAGNILGGVAGAVLGTGISKKMLTLITGVLAGLLLWFGTTRVVARLLGGVVAVMGIAFFVTAIQLRPPLLGLTLGMLKPSLPAGSGLLIMGLIGTTVVPYNLFLGSGLAQNSNLKSMRFGLSVAILLGGAISMAVLVTGTAINGHFSFEALTAMLSQQLGGWARALFALGLFSAGFSSAITAPLAAAVTARSLFAGDAPGAWHERNFAYRAVWLGVLLVGVVFGLLEVAPIPAIILAQALNGFLLPMVAIFLLIVVNKRELMQAEALNHWLANLVMGFVVAVTVLLGIAQIGRAFSRALSRPMPGENALLLFSAVLTLILAVPVGLAMRRARGSSNL